MVLAMFEFSVLQLSLSFIQSFGTYAFKDKLRYPFCIVEHLSK